MEQPQFQLIDAILSIAGIAEQRGLLETENYLHLARSSVFFDNAMRMAISGEDPEVIGRHISDSINSEKDPAQRLLKRIVGAAIPLIISGSTLIALRLTLLTIVPDAERYYADRLFKIEKRKIAFYSYPVALDADPQLRSRTEDFFITRITGSRPLDMPGVSYRDIAVALLGCSLPVRIKVFEFFPSIEVEGFLDFYTGENVTAENVNESMLGIIEWDRKDRELAERLKSSPIYQSL